MKEKALKDRCFQSKKKKKAEKETKNRRRNRPFKKNVSTNAIKRFLNLIDKQFPKDNKLQKILNRNNVKVGYSCTENMKSVITAHNKKLLSEDTDTVPRTESRTNAHCMENAEPEIFYTNAWLQLV